MSVDPKTLPQDAETLKRMLVEVTAQLDRTERLLRQLLQAKTGRKSEQFSREQLALFAAELGLGLPERKNRATTRMKGGRRAHPAKAEQSRVAANHCRAI